MSAQAINLVSLPNEILFIITEYIIDPCDLLALRRSHSIFNNLLQNRFNSTFRNTPCTRRQNKKPTLDAVLFWAARHNHVRFAEKTLRLVEEGRKRLRDGQRNSLTENGCLQAACEAVRGGHTEMLTVLLQVVNDEDYYTCFEVAVSEGNYETAVVVLENARLDEWVSLVNEEGVGPLLLLMKNHEVHLVEFWGDALDVYTEAAGEALMAYAELLQDHEEGWCQRIVFSVLENASGLVDTNKLVDLFRKAEERECDPECWMPEGGNDGIEGLKYYIEQKGIERPLSRADTERLRLAERHERQ